MAETWYRVSSSALAPVEVERFTESSVWVREPRFFLAAGAATEYDVRRHPHRSDYANYYPTKAEAVGHLVTRARAALDSARTRVAVAERAMHKLRDQYPDAPEWAGAEDGS